MSNHIKGQSRTQATLFPEVLDDFIAEDNPVRVIDVFVDEDNPDVLILDQKWKSKENHQAYVQMRKDTGLFDKLTDMLVVEPEIRYIKALS